MNVNEDETLDINVDDLFKDIDEESKIKPAIDADNDQDLMTKAVSKRINEVKEKTADNTRENIAKELGYESFAELQKAKEKELLNKHGLDETEITEVVNKLVDARIKSDPRFKKLEELEVNEKNTFVINQLKEISTIAGITYTNIDQLPKDTLEVWEKTGNLKQAYLATKGEELLLKSKTSKNNGSTTHLATPGSAGSTTKSRYLTEEEKAIYKSVMPDITDEELSKKTTKLE